MDFSHTYPSYKQTLEFFQNTYYGGYTSKNICQTVKGKFGKRPTFLLQTLTGTNFLLAAPLLPRHPYEIL